MNKLIIAGYILLLGMAAFLGLAIPDTRTSFVGTMVLPLSCVTLVLVFVTYTTLRKDKHPLLLYMINIVYMILATILLENAAPLYAGLAIILLHQYSHHSARMTHLGADRTMITVGRLAMVTNALVVMYHLNVVATA